MNINCLSEEFDFSPYKLFGEEYEFSVLYEETQREYKDISTEANKDVNKKNILQKIFIFIKKIISLISRGVKNIINFIKSLFKKKTKSADQIAVKFEINFKRARVNQTNKPSSSGDSHVVHMPLIANPKSEVSPPEDIKLIYKDLMVKINDDNTISMSINRAIDLSGSTKAPGHKMVRKLDSVNAIGLIVYPGMMDELVSISESIKEVFPDKDASAIIKKYYLWLLKFDSTSFDQGMHIPLESIIGFQDKLNRIMDNFSIVDDINIDTSKTPRDVLEFFNRFGAFCERVQMGINFISGALQNLYIVDARYIECISNIEDLSEFINDAIKSGMPPKYISYNAYILSTKALKGDGTNGSETKPCWGQTRVVFFPDNNKSIVHKIALNGFGIRCNRIESQATDLFKNNGGAHLIAPIINSTDTFTIVSAERIVMGDMIPGKSLSSIQSDISTFIRVHKLPISIEDLHPGNIGIKGDHYVVADYGSIWRI